MMMTMLVTKTKELGTKKTEKDEENTNSDTDNEDFDPWNKLRGEVINDLNPFWEEQVEENLRQGCQRMMLRLKLVAFYFLLPQKSYDTYIYNI